MSVSLLALLTGCYQREPFYLPEQEDDEVTKPETGVDYPDQFALYSAFSNDGSTSISSEMAIIDISQQSDGQQFQKLWSMNGENLTLDGSPYIQDLSDFYEIAAPVISNEDPSLMHALVFQGQPFGGTPANHGQIITFNQNGEIFSACDVEYGHHSFTIDDQGNAYYAEMYGLPVEDSSDFALGWVEENLNEYCDHVDYILMDRIMKMDLATCEKQEFVDTYDIFTPTDKPGSGSIQCLATVDINNPSNSENVNSIDYTHINDVGYTSVGSDGTPSVYINSPFLNTFVELTEDGVVKLALLGRDDDHHERILRNSVDYLGQNERP